MSLPADPKLVSLWAGLRLVVIDTETTPSPDGGPLRTVSLAAVTCRGGVMRGTWHTLVDPDVPIAPAASRIHGITDELVVGEPRFSAVAQQVLSVLEERDDERTVLCAHNASFDVAVLRAELARVGLDLPDVALLDTMGALPALVGVRPASKSLEGLLNVLGLTNPQPHQALADAQSCAQAALLLLERAAAAGFDDFDTLHAQLGRRTHTHAVKPNRRAFDAASASASAPASNLSATHLEGHSSLLGRRPSRPQLWAWSEQVRECATLRCEHLTGRVSEAQAPARVLLAELHEVLDERISVSDTAGTATVLAALLPLLDQMERRGSQSRRTATLRWEKSWGPRLSALGRCGEDAQSRCPACRAQETCALDAWPEVVGAIALGDPEAAAGTLLGVSGARKGKGTYATWRASGVDARVADAALWRVVEHQKRTGHDDRAVALERQAWASGCRHPDLASDYAGRIAVAGKKRDLTRALKVCDDAFAARAGSTLEGWTRLLSRRQQVAGRLQRLNVRASGAFDEDGNAIPARAHTPQNPRRTRVPRFARP